MAVTSPAATTAAHTPKKLGWRQYSGYATGDAANNLAFAMSSSFLLLYYTNVVGLSGAAIGTMFLLIRFWDAFADLVRRSHGRRQEARAVRQVPPVHHLVLAAAAAVEHGDLLGQDVLPRTSPSPRP